MSSILMEVEKSSVQVKENVTKEHRVIEAFDFCDVMKMVNGKPGHDGIRQGDLYFKRLRALPAGVSKTNNMQLVNGNTQGSRHVVQYEEGISVYTLDKAGPLDGPIICSTLDTGITIDHPEHHKYTFAMSGIWAVKYQQDRNNQAVKD